MPINYVKYLVTVDYLICGETLLVASWETLVEFPLAHSSEGENRLFLASNSSL